MLATRKKAWIVVAASLSLLIALTAAPHWLPGPKGQPRTVNQAVQRILSEGWLSEANRDWILRNPEATVCATLHFSLGMAIRNRFDLWGGNLPLTFSCRRLHPDACSWVIIEALWRKVRQKADPVLIKTLDAQFRRLQVITIKPGGLAKLTIMEGIASIQRQIDQQTPGQPGKLPGKVHLRVVGALNLQATILGFSEDEPDSLSLQRFLDLFAFRNGFRVRNDPPNVELVFRKTSGALAPPVRDDDPKPSAR